MKRIKTFGLAALVILWAVLSLTLWFGPKADYTYSERRPLAQMPEITGKTLFSGEFAEKFEDFTLDQFPLREAFRTAKSLFHYYVLNQSDNNGIYLVDDTVAKLESPLSRPSVKYATGRFGYLYDTYLAGTDCKLYATMIPDKGYFLAEANGYPAMDYAALEELYRDGVSFASYIDIKAQLSAGDYYRTDTHWRQEKILAVAQTICDAMGAQTPKEDDYSRTTVENFYGVYFGQAALPMAGEDLVMLESELLQNCTVTDPITGKRSRVYDAVESADLYDAFLSGAQPLLVVENPAGEGGKELVIFRDSFGSSLAPLLLQGYSKVTLIDIRYLHPDQIGNYVNFQSQDVLFAYSTLILNSGRSLK